MFLRESQGAVEKVLEQADIFKKLAKKNESLKTHLANDINLPKMCDILVLCSSSWEGKAAWANRGELRCRNL